MNPKTTRSSFFATKDVFSKITIIAFLLAAFMIPAFAQDDDEAIPGKVMDASNRQAGKAELILDTGDVKTNFGYNIKLWLDGGSRLRLIRPQSGSRSSTITCSFREYKVDPKNPKDSTKWDETGSGTATLQMPASGDVQKITVSIALTKKVVGDDEVSANEKPQKFVIVLD
jgi:hypothetical protein